MSESELKDTQPTPIGETQPSSTKRDTQPRPTGKRFPRWLVALVVILVLLVGVLAGYGSGMGQRDDAKKTQVAGQLQEQLDLGIQKMNAGQYDLAQQHFEFIIQNDPNFPGVMDAYTELLLRMQISPTPTASATPNFTPTPDLRSAETIYATIKADLTARDWDSALADLDSLRKTAPTYRTAEVDGMYYLALRMRGYEKIVPPSQLCSDVNLEGGIYDLTLAERFGTLDSIAQSLRTYARLYIIGASYWDQDWIKAQDYFNQVMSAYPAMQDSSCMSATERWRYATVKYAEQLLASGDTCGAQDQFDLAFTITSPWNEGFFPTATQAYNLCHEGGGEGGGDQVTPEGTPTGEGTPAETPTPTPSEAPTP
jgi:tetratricopeptide (TPR) repeat protein